jgi:hypothetical protein
MPLALERKTTEDGYTQLELDLQFGSEGGEERGRRELRDVRAMAAPMRATTTPIAATTAIQARLPSGRSMGALIFVSRNRQASPSMIRINPSPNKAVREFVEPHSRYGARR